MLALILRDLIRAGVKFETDGERIRWRNASGRMTPEVIDTLKANKAEAIALLASKPATDAAVRAAFADYAATDDPNDWRAWQ